MMNAVESIKIKAPLYYKPSLQRDKQFLTDGILVGQKLLSTHDEINPITAIRPASGLDPRCDVVWRQ